MLLTNSGKGPEVFKSQEQHSILATEDRKVSGRRDSSQVIKTNKQSKRRSYKKIFTSVTLVNVFKQVKTSFHIFLLLFNLYSDNIFKKTVGDIKADEKINETAILIYSGMREMPLYNVYCIIMYII